MLKILRNGELNNLIMKLNNLMEKLITLCMNYINVIQYTYSKLECKTEQSKSKIDIFKVKIDTFKVQIETFPEKWKKQKKRNFEGQSARVQHTRLSLGRPISRLIMRPSRPSFCESHLP